MWFIGVEVEQETSAPPPKKDPGSAPETIRKQDSLYLAHSQAILTAHLRLILNLKFLIDKVTIRMRLVLSYDTC